MPEEYPVGAKLLDDWEEDRVWFRDLIPTDLPWGDEEVLDPVPEKAEGSYGVKFAATAQVGEERYEKDQVAIVGTRTEFVRLFFESANIAGIIVPWYKRVVPAALLKPFEHQIDGDKYRKELGQRFVKALAISVGLIAMGFYFKQFLMLALLGAAFYGLFPLVEVALTYFRKVEKIPVEQLNQRVVNSEFFRRWILSQPNGFMKIALGVLIAVYLGQMAVDMSGARANPMKLPSIEEAALVRSASGPATIKDGEWWRLVTTGLMHGSIPHILFNGMALYSLGRVIAALVTPHLLSLVFLVSVVTGSLASLYLGLPPGGASVGASGGILGCLGFLLVLTYRFLGKIPGFLRLSLIQSTIVVSIFGLIGNAFIDNYAHLGGFLGGVGLGLVFFPWLSLDARKPGFVVRVLGWLSMAVLAAAVIKIAIELIGLR